MAKTTVRKTGAIALTLIVFIDFKSHNQIKRFEKKTIKAAKKRRAAKTFLTLLANDLRQHLNIR